MESEFLEIMNERKNGSRFSRQKNPLEQALQFGSIVEIEDILCEKHQATLSSENDWAKRCRQIINICLDKKLDVNMEETNYCALLHFVMKHLDEDFESVIKKCEKFDINSLNVVDMPEDEKSLLHLAIDEKKPNLVKILIEFGADVNVRDSRSWTPLFYAVFSKQIEVAEMLLKAGADISAKDSGNMMPINYAFGERKDTSSNEKYKPSKLVKLLCSYGADLNFKNPSGSSTLVMVCRKGNFKEIEFLIEHGADLLSSDVHGTTALHSAAVKYNYKLVDFLIRRGIDINAQDWQKESSIHHLADTLDTISNVLQYCGDNTYEAISVDWNLDFEGNQVKKAAEMIQFLADNGADVNAFSKQNITPLMISVRYNALEITECLLELNAKICNSDNSSFYYGSLSRQINTALHSHKITTWALLTAFIALKNIGFPKNTFTSDEIHWIIYSLQECREEVLYMQEKRIWTDRKVTFYDFLNEDLLKVTKYFRNDDVMSVLKSDTYDEFPDYRYFFEKRRERVEKIKNCQNVFIRFLKEFFKRNLPSVVIHEVMSYLTAGDLRNFGRAFCITEKSPNEKYFI
ncbi:putative ankyrin repeat protein RF_0381 [Leptopilina heterotoma]|uniref:putative ankyrin repeat protein RF_0381 n=1 Tax=Leptopilina heterotoma TaxID=63436 RepID=UPI001CA8AAE7|nr:putative ankyrin repeat protein RF_0381 [Leptopilina heterotoma]